MSSNPQVRVGVGVFILQSPSSNTKNPRFLIGKRKGAHGAGTHALPGGHLEYSETFSQCATREVLEETGLEIKNVQFLTATNDFMEAEGRHYVTVFMVCERNDASKEAEVLEKEKCEGWEWWDWSELVGRVEGGGEGVFLPLVDLVRQREGVVPSL